MNSYQDNAIFWVEVEKIKPNPYQPRHDFDEAKLNDLAESIRQYGVLQPLVVTRQEVATDDGGLRSEYELIAGERRLRASKIAGLAQIPVIIRSGEEDGRMKLELAIIENLQREDLNPIDRANAFKRLYDEFNFRQSQIARQIGKSREYVTNSMRMLSLPEDVQQALADGRLSEGHARPMMMLNDRPEEQGTLFREIIYKKITVREAERIARRVAHDKVRKHKQPVNPQLRELEGELTESLGTRVHIEQGEVGGKVVIDYFSDEDLHTLLSMFKSHQSPEKMLDRFIAAQQGGQQPENREVRHEGSSGEVQGEGSPETAPEQETEQSAESAGAAGAMGEQGGYSEETRQAEQPAERAQDGGSESGPETRSDSEAHTEGSSRPERSNEERSGEQPPEVGEGKSFVAEERAEERAEDRTEEGGEQEAHDGRAETHEGRTKSEEDLYSVRNFNI